jgi:ribosomal protein S18 acetylase RimI-like enzyme
MKNDAGVALMFEQRAGNLNNDMPSVEADRILRRAMADDTAAIYSLKQQAFNLTSLPYTIYQAPQSVKYIEELIVSGSSLGHDFTVACLNQSIVGYYHAVYHAGEYFLNYIAVDRQKQGLGLGRALLDRFESAGRSVGCIKLALDVFHDNVRAVALYQSLGYQLADIRFHTQLGMAVSGSPPPPLLYGEASWLQAINQESEYGFSRLICQCGPGEVVIGLIGKRWCKLLSFSGVAMQDAISAIGSAFQETREGLIISGLAHLPNKWPVLRADKVLRLVKPL